jgi:hypothetical protein
MAVDPFTHDPAIEEAEYLVQCAARLEVRSYHWLDSQGSSWRVYAASPEQGPLVNLAEVSHLCLQRGAFT